MNLLFLGPPASGKGTQARILTKIYGFTHLNTGDIFRQALADKTPLGIQAYEQYWRKGQLVPDNITNVLAVEQLKTLRDNIILDGYPRTLVQAQALDTYLTTETIALDAAILFDCTNEVAYERACNRKICTSCGEIYGLSSSPTTGICNQCRSSLKIRIDDQTNLIQSRLEVYALKTAPLIAYYQKKNILQTIDATKNTDEVTAQIHSLLRRS